MTGKTHACAGMLAAEVVLVATGAPIEYWSAGLLFGAIAALLPDLDQKGSTVTVTLPFAGILSHFFKHRTVTHGLVGILAFSLLLRLAFPLMPVSLFMSIVAGYISHPVVDMANHMGIAIFSPFKTGIKLRHIDTIGGYAALKFPFFNITTGGDRENKVFRPLLWVGLIALTLSPFYNLINLNGTLDQFINTMDMKTLIPAILETITVIIVANIITKHKWAWLFHGVIILSGLAIIGEWLWKVSYFQVWAISFIEPAAIIITDYYSVLIPFVNPITSMFGYIIK
jgi:membrane-bound metal-dependent hydrolase YbcI (DUF457 family)